jgi:membrane protease YdiL (CAAX protease family)
MSAIVNPVPSVQPSPVRGLIIRHPLLIYFLLAFLGTWTMILPLALSEDGAGLFPYRLPEPILLLIFFGSAFAGPLLASIIVTAAESGRAGVRLFLRRFVQWRVGARWYIAAIFIFLFIFLAAYSLFLRGAPLVNLLRNWQLIFSVFLPNVALGILFPSLGEEPGWRGFALPRLQSRYGPLLGTALLGLLHGLWHLPAFFTPFLGPFTPSRFLAFIITAVFASYFYTWLFNNTRGSILIAMITHGASNAASQLMGMVIPDAPLSGWLQAIGPDWLNVITFGVAAALLLLLTRGRLAYRGETQAPASPPTHAAAQTGQE